MAKFTSEDALRSRWSPAAKPRAVAWFGGLGVLFLVIAVGLWFVVPELHGAGYWLALLALVLAGLTGLACVGAAFAIQCTQAVGRLLFTFAFPIFLVGVVAIMVIAWAPALLYEQIDALVAAPGKPAAQHGLSAVEPLSVAHIQALLTGQTQEGQQPPRASHLAHAAVLWVLQFRLTRDVLAMVGVVGFVSLVAMFGIWWERKVAGRMQSRLGPMRVGGWHGWAQSMADGIKLIQKEDILIGGADRPLFNLAPYVAFVPAMCLFIVLPFSAAWVARDLDVGLIFIFAMLGVGVLGVLIAGWASNNKWSMFGAMREACQMISYEIPLGFSLLIPIMVAGSLRLTAIGELQSGGFHTWLAFRNPFTLAAAVIFFIATLASCKRSPFDLPEAESELVAGYHTEYSGFRWALFFFAEYAEMFAVAALAAVLFFGAWYSPLPVAWGAAWEHGPLWQRALHGIVFNGPLWFVLKGFFFFYVQIWLRWTLPRVRLDQVMYACVQVLLPLSMVILLGNTFWELWVRGGSAVALVANVACAAVGALTVVSIIGVVLYGYMHRRRLVGTMVIDHLPGS